MTSKHIMTDVGQAALRFLLTMPLASKSAYLIGLDWEATYPFPYTPQVKVRVTQVWGAGELGKVGEHMDAW